MAASAKWVEGLAPDCTVEEAARRTLGPRLSSVVHSLPMAAHLAEHDIEHVHRLRVATRRATAALRLYRDCATRKHVRWMKKCLRRIRRVAGDARDLDVLADRFARDYGEPASPVIELILNDRAAVQPAIVQAARYCRADDRYVLKTAKLLRSIRQPICGVESKKPLYRDWAIGRFSEVGDRFMAALPRETSDVAALHQFRIRAKGVRYAIELVAPAFDPELRKQLYPIMEELQQRLGRVQDHVAAIARCRNWAAAIRNAALCETLNELAEAETRGLADATQEFRAWWTTDLIDRVSALLCLSSAVKS